MKLPTSVGGHLLNVLPENNGMRARQCLAETLKESPEGNRFHPLVTDRSLTSSPASSTRVRGFMQESRLKRPETHHVLKIFAYCLLETSSKMQNRPLGRSCGRSEALLLRTYNKLHKSVEKTKLKLKVPYAETCQFFALFQTPAAQNSKKLTYFIKVL